MTEHDADVLLEYSYRKSHAQDLDDLISALESDLGGERRPYGSRCGAIDLVTFLEVCLTWAVGTALAQLFKKYSEGLLDADAIKSLGKTHRAELKAWYSVVEEKVNAVVTAAERVCTITPRLNLDNYEKCLAIRFGLAGDATCWVVLNHSRMTSAMLRRIPLAVVSALRHSIEVGLPDDTRAAQLYYDLKSESWPYLFTPTVNGFGNFVDRYINLQTGEVHTLSDADEFLNVFQPDDDERFQLIISPLFHRDAG